MTIKSINFKRMPNYSRQNWSHSGDITVFPPVLSSAQTLYCSPWLVHDRSTCPPMLAGVVLAGVSQISAVFSPIPPGAYTGEILLDIQAYPTVLARFFETLVLLVTYCPNPALCARTKERRTVQSSAVGSILARLQLTRVLVGALT